MRSLALLMVLGCGGGGPDVFGKSWTKLTSVPGSPFVSGTAFDSQGRLIIATLEGSYRFDLADRKWSFFTPAPGAIPSTEIANDFAGVISPAPDGYYRLADDDSWHKVADLPPDGAQNASLTADDTLYWFMPDMNQRYAMWRRRGGVDVMLRADLNFIGLGPDSRGRPVLQLVTDSRGFSSVGYIGEDGNFTTTLYTCDPLNPDPWCLQTGDRFVADDNGDVSFVGINDVRGSKIYRVPSGATSPEVVATFPVADGDDRTFNHSISFHWDAAGNAYTTRTDNRFGDEVLFVLPAGDSAFREVIDTPGLVDAALVRADGTVFLMNGGTGEKLFYVLE